MNDSRKPDDEKKSQDPEASNEVPLAPPMSESSGPPSAPPIAPEMSAPSAPPMAPMAPSLPSVNAASSSSSAIFKAVKLKSKAPERKETPTEKLQKSLNPHLGELIGKRVSRTLLDDVELAGYIALAKKHVLAVINDIQEEYLSQASPTEVSPNSKPRVQFSDQEIIDLELDKEGVDVKDTEVRTKSSITTEQENSKPKKSGLPDENKVIKNILKHEFVNSSAGVQYIIEMLNKKLPNLPEIKISMLTLRVMNTLSAKGKLKENLDKCIDAISEVFEKKAEAALKIDVPVGIQGYVAVEGESFANDPLKGAQQNQDEIYPPDEAAGKQLLRTYERTQVTGLKSILKKPKEDKAGPEVNNSPETPTTPKNRGS